MRITRAFARLAVTREVRPVKLQARVEAQQVSNLSQSRARSFIAASRAHAMNEATLWHTLASNPGATRRRVCARSSSVARSGKASWRLASRSRRPDHAA